MYLLCIAIVSLSIELNVDVWFADCHTKIHKEHFDKEESIGFCNVNSDVHTAKEMLLLANSSEEQQHWVKRLQRKVEKQGFAQSNTDRTPGYVSRGPPYMRHSMAALTEEQVAVRRSSVSDFRPSRQSLPPYMLKGHSPQH